MIVKVKISCGAFASNDPSFLRQAFTRKNMPKLYRFIEVATKKALGDKSSLPRFHGRTAFYDDDRRLTKKTGPHLITQFQARVETSSNGEELVVDNKKTVGTWNVFWMLTDGTRWYNARPKFMHFFDRYGSWSSTSPGWRTVQFRRGNEQFVPIFNTWLESRAQFGVEKGVELWDMSGAKDSEFYKVLKRAGFSVVK